MHVKQIGMSLEKHKYIGPLASSYKDRIIGSCSHVLRAMVTIHYT